MQAGRRNSRSVIGLIEDFLFAGTSCLLLSLAHSSERFWYLSFIAFIPLLARASRVHCPRCFALGGMLGLGYALVMRPTVAGEVLSGFLLSALSLSILLAAYTASVSLFARRLAFSSVVAATLWLPVEIVLRKSALAEGLFSSVGTHTALLFRMSSLFGLLFVPFLVVMVNSLVLSLCMPLFRRSKEKKDLPADSDSRWRLDPYFLPVGSVAHSLLRNRAPPFPRDGSLVPEPAGAAQPEW